MANALLDAIQAGVTAKKPLVWLDAEAYGAEVVRNGKAFPWTNPTEFVSSYGQLQSLLKPGVAPVNLGRFLHAWLDANANAINEMSGKKRVRYAIKRLLGMDGPRAVIREIVKALCDSVSQPIVLVLPTNGELINWANQKANGAEAQVLTEIDIDSVSVYLADFLRTFSGLDIAGILVQLPDGTNINPELLDLYSPIINVAKHYHWAMGMEVSNASVTDTDEVLQYVIASNSQTGTEVITGIIQNKTFWEDEVANCQSPGFVYAYVPAQLKPEQVLACLATLK
jgi:hypothetical protein